MKRSALSSGASACLLLPLLVSCNPPAVLQPETLFRATFNSDVVNSPPGPPEVGTWSLRSDDGSALVRSAVGNLTSKPLELTHFGPAPGSPTLFGDFAGSATRGQVVARWSSLVHSSTVEYGSITFAGPGGIVASVDHRPQGHITLNNQTNIVGSWTHDVAQTFELAIDLDRRTTSLKINQAAAPGAQAVPFESPSGPTPFDRLALHAGGTTPEVHAWDDLEVVIWR